MKTLHVIILLSFFSFDSKAQKISDYYYEIYQADLLVEKGNLDSALICYETAFEKYDFTSTKLLVRPLNIAKKVGNKTLIKKYKGMIKAQKYCPKENKQILNKVDSILKLDQMIRKKRKYRLAFKYYQKHINDSLKNTSSRFVKAEKLCLNYQSIDSSNIYYLIDLINKEGFIGEEAIGYKNSYKFHVVLLHFDKDTNNTILAPILTKALTNNQISPLAYAAILDRHLYATSKTQKYYTWPMIDSDPKLTPEDIERIIKLREEIGIWGSDLKVFNNNGRWSLNNISGSAY